MTLKTLILTICIARIPSAEYILDHLGATGARIVVGKQTLTISSKENIMKITFRSIGVNTKFKMNGNTYIKKSTRTAKLIGVGRTFYFSQMDIVEA